MPVSNLTDFYLIRYGGGKTYKLRASNIPDKNGYNSLKENRDMRPILLIPEPFGRFFT